MLANAVRQYGRSSFELQVLASSDNRDELDQLETLWILFTGSMQRRVGYNLCNGGRTPRVTEEIREKLRISHTGKKQPPELIEKRLGWKRGRPTSEETKLKMSLAAKGRSISPEMRAKISATMKRRRTENPEIWEHLSSPEMRAKMWRRRKELQKSRKEPRNEYVERIC